MFLQDTLDVCINSHQNHAVVIEELHQILSSQEGVIFCDFDDTCIMPGISTEAYFRGYQCARRLGLSTRPFLLPTVTLSPAFLTILSPSTRLIILTRNYSDYVKDMISHLQKDLQHYGLECIGTIGKVPPHFYLSSCDKLAVLPDKGRLITDVFEYRSLSHDSRCLFLASPWQVPLFLVFFWHGWIKIRDLCRGFMSAL